MKKISEKDHFSNGDVSIGNDVWIGYGATIMSGVSIGDGAVIGAQSVVTKNVPPYAIYVGNPAKLIKYRHVQEDIDALLMIKWWDWSDEILNENLPLMIEDMKKFIELNKK